MRVVRSGPRQMPHRRSDEARAAAIERGCGLGMGRSYRPLRRLGGSCVVSRQSPPVDTDNTGVCMSGYDWTVGMEVVGWRSDHAVLM